MEAYTPKNKIRFVTAASLFDGHDVTINIIRRLLQASGVEVIHLGHNRSVDDIVSCAIEEDVQGIAVSSYQGGHMEYFTYMYDLLQKAHYGHIKIFGGGGGVILPQERNELIKYGIANIYLPDDGRKLGLHGMIADMVQKTDFSITDNFTYDPKKITKDNFSYVARLISVIENEIEINTSELLNQTPKQKVPVVGITGTGGSGKSSLIDELVGRFLFDFPEKRIAILSYDPSKRKSGGALLGDRLRMNAVFNPRVFMRSQATRQVNLALSSHAREVLSVLRNAGFDLIILETSGIGQSDTEIVGLCDLSIYVMTPEFGAPTQLEKIDMIDYADMIVLNKADKRGAEDALRDIRKQYQRTHNRFDTQIHELPVFPTIASEFNNHGVYQLYVSLFELLNTKVNMHISIPKELRKEVQGITSIIPNERIRYLSEIAETVRDYNKWAEEQSSVANQLYSVHTTLSLLKEKNKDLDMLFNSLKSQLDESNFKIIESWTEKVKKYTNEYFVYTVRSKEIKIKTHIESLSHLLIPKISLPRYKNWGDILKWNLKENVPGEFPFASGVFHFKREEEDPTRMFAGEGGPERTNKRFHYVSRGLKAKRLSTAFDSVTLYGEDPDLRPDIYGKIGNAGVSICCLDDAKKLYSGFNLASPYTSVSMTINGPAPTITAFFMNAAIDQACELYIRHNGLTDSVVKKINDFYKGKSRPQYQGSIPEGNDGLGLMLLGITGDHVLPKDVYEKIKFDTLANVRGTVQADILKEDQAQNTCIFSKEFSLKLMGDVQEYFSNNNVRNFYSVSISGYHIAEAGANPITQLAFTLANGFTYVEYYRARGMKIDEFVPNFSFFFSNGIDPEFSVIGRVARIIWAKAMKLKYNANERAQKLKYHIQTSGRSLHAQEIAFNDIRTTLQALYAIYDNCNSLHTNAYDEAITTPTEESVRRAMAIQLVINHELGLAKNENPLQGSFIIEELTDLVEEAVLSEFDRITSRGGVLGAMESMYQRAKIQEESLYYESLKHSGELPIIGVNTFLSSEGSPTIIPREVIRSTEEEKKYQISMLTNLHKTYEKEAKAELQKLQQKALLGTNLFEELLEATKYCSLGQITNALYEVGGRYRRNM